MTLPTPIPTEYNVRDAYVLFSVRHRQWQEALTINLDVYQDISEMRRLTVLSERARTWSLYCDARDAYHRVANSFLGPERDSIRVARLEAATQFRA